MIQHQLALPGTIIVTPDPRDHEKDFHILLVNEFNKYPKMKPCDAVKLVFQGLFGGGHLIKDWFYCLERIENEGSDLTAEQYMYPEIERISEEYSRMNLSVLTRLPYDVVGRMFMKSNEAEEKTAEKKEVFLFSLQMIKDMSEKGESPFTYKEATEYIDSYIEEVNKTGEPFAPHHSKEYVEAYKPAYRVVKNTYCDNLEIFVKLSRLYSSGNFASCAIDGMTASGKTKLAELIAGIFQCNVFHTEDFRLPPVMRTKSAMHGIGSDFDIDRFKSEIVDHLQDTESFSWGVYNPEKGKYDKRKAVAPERLNIVEGLYSMHPKLGKYYDLGICVDSDDVVQARILSSKYGAEGYRQFAEASMVKEKKYLDENNIRLSADIVIDCVE